MKQHDDRTTKCVFISYSESCLNLYRVKSVESGYEFWSSHVEFSEHVFLRPNDEEAHWSLRSPLEDARHLMTKGERIKDILPPAFTVDGDGLDHPAFNRIIPGSVVSPDWPMVTAPDVDPDDPVEGQARVDRAERMDRMVRIFQNPEILQKARENLKAAQKIGKSNKGMPSARVSRRLRGLTPEFPHGVNESEVVKGINQSECSSDTSALSDTVDLWNVAVSSVDWTLDNNPHYCSNLEVDWSSMSWDFEESEYVRESEG